MYDLRAILKQSFLFSEFACMAFGNVTIND